MIIRSTLGSPAGFPYRKQEPPALEDSEDDAKTRQRPYKAGDCLLNAGPSVPSELCTTKVSVKKRVEADDVFRGVIVSLVCSTRGTVVVMTYRKREFVIVDRWAWDTLLRMPKLTPLPT